MIGKFKNLINDPEDRSYIGRNELIKYEQY